MPRMLAFDEPACRGPFGAEVGASMARSRPLRLARARPSRSAVSRPFGVSDDRASARMLGIAALSGLGFWVGLAAILL